MDVTADDQRCQEAMLPTLVPDLDGGQILGPVAQVDPASDQGRVHLVLVAGEAHGRRPGHAPLGGPQEGGAQELGVGMPWHGPGMACRR